MEIQPFLTAYDPSDLPGTSIDPLGFERGYLFLSDKILPGLTNVANRPRYFSILCTGAYLAGNLFYDSPRRQYNERLDRVTRLERFWALANVLAYMAEESESRDLSGLRGVTYAQTRAAEITKRGQKWVDADFKLLIRQVQYGGVGIYGNVADGMRFLDRRTLSLSADLGEKLAKGFIKESEMPGAIEKAVEENSSVDIDTLTEWGGQAYINGAVGEVEAECFGDALYLNPVRSRMAEVLAQYPCKESEPELERLSRINKALENGNKNLDLQEGINAILWYEKAYRWALLGLERVLWLCRQDQSGSTSHEALQTDPIMGKVRGNLPKTVAGFVNALEKSCTEHFRRDLHNLDDICLFLKGAASACDNGEALTEKIMARHADIQRGKFDKGRRKMPWIELTTAGRITLTSTRVGGLDFEATKTSQILPHPYRLESADVLFAAARQR